jgi:ferric-dicitrate binding protein FerR (iron transport regulator)
MSDYSKLHECACRYFEGKSSLNDEATLCEFLSKDEEHRALFRQWELAWSAMHKADEATDRSWQMLAEKLSDSHKTFGTLFRRLVRYSAAAAAAVLLVAGGVWAGSRGRISADDAYTYSVPNGSQGKLLLPDGTGVWLNAGSQLTYSARFNKDNRRVVLHGEGYFEVTKHQGAKFTVSTNGCDVVVHGTKFNVSAYDNENVVTTELMEGSVELQRGQQSLRMQPGETVALDKTTGRMVKELSTGDSKAWVTGAAVYDDMTLTEIARALSRRYAVNIRIATPALGQERYSLSLYNSEDIEDVLKALARVAPIKVVRQGKDITLRYVPARH